MDKRRKKKEVNPIETRKAFYESVAQNKFSIPAAVRAMRKITRLTQAEYAAMVGVSAQALKNIEQGRANPTVETLEKVARPFGLVLTFRRR